MKRATEKLTTAETHRPDEYALRNGQNERGSWRPATATTSLTWDLAGVTSGPAADDVSDLPASSRTGSYDNYNIIAPVVEGAG